MVLIIEIWQGSCRLVRPQVTTHLLVFWCYPRVPSRPMCTSPKAHGDPRISPKTHVAPAFWGSRGGEAFGVEVGGLLVAPKKLQRLHRSLQGASWKPFLGADLFQTLVSSETPEQYKHDIQLYFWSPAWAGPHRKAAGHEATSGQTQPLER
jgi:hypothetical protein